MPDCLVQENQQQRGELRKGVSLSNSEQGFFSVFSYTCLPCPRLLAPRPHVLSEHQIRKIKSGGEHAWEERTPGKTGQKEEVHGMI